MISLDGLKMDSAAEPLILFSQGSPREALKGSPRRIWVRRLERAKGSAYLQEVAEFEKGQRVLERRFYLRDGGVHYRQVYSYDSEGRLFLVAQWDGEGALMRVETMRVMPDGTEAMEATDASGVVMERAMSRRDEQGRVLHSTLVVYAGSGKGMEMELTAQYGGEGESDRQRVRWRQESGEIFLLDRRLEGDGWHTTISWAPDESAPFALMRDVRPGEMTTIERVIERDQQGNWTRMELFSSGDSRGFAGVFRTIEYY